MSGTSWASDLEASPHSSSESEPTAKGDRVEERLDWDLHQRSYPYGGIFADAYSEASRRYVAARNEARRLAATPGFAPDHAGLLPTARWLEVGPAPMRNAIFSYGDVAGRISTVALHPADPEVALAGGSAGGIWRTTNASAAPPTWAAVGDDLPTLAIADIEFAPSNPSVVYAASGDDDVNLWGMGVFKSSDGGSSWARVDDGSVARGIPDGTVLSKIVVHASDPDRVVAVARRDYTQGGADDPSSIFVSSDGGLTWSRAPLPGGGTTSRFRELVVESGCRDRLWVVDYGNGRIIRSLDFGGTWLGIPATGLPAFTDNTKLAVHHPSCGGVATLYASVFSASSLAGDVTKYAGVYASNDDGATWARPGAAGPSGGCLAQCGYDHEMLADPLDPQRVYLIGRDFWQSTDGGTTWLNVSGGFSDSNGYSGGRMHVDLHALELRGGGNTATLWIGGDGGVWTYDVTSDAFTNRVGNLATAELVDLALHPDTANLAIGGTQDNGTILYDGNIQWPTVLHGDGGFSGFLRNASGTTNPYDGAFTTYVYASAYHSTNRGQNFRSFAGSAAFSNENNEFYGPWIGTDNRLWHGAESLWYCDWPARCNRFTRRGPNLATMTSSDYISKLSIHLQSPGVYGPYYAATAYARGFLASDDGLVWQVRSSGLPDRYITRIVHHPGQPQSVWVSLSGFGTPHVWYSPDGGQSWQNRSGDLPNVPINVILLDVAQPLTTWMVGSDVGVWGTRDGGVTWRVVGTNLPAVRVSDLEYGPDGLLYAATRGRSVWAVAYFPNCAGPVLAVANTVRAIRTAGDVSLTWTDPQAARDSWNLYRSATKTNPGAPLATSTPSYLDVGAIAVPPVLYHYKVVATCAGSEGPF